MDALAEFSNPIRSSLDRRQFLSRSLAGTAGVVLGSSVLAQPGGDRPQPAAGVPGRQSAGPRAAQLHHRRLDLPGEPGALLHSAVRRGLSRPLQAGLAQAAARDPGRLRPQVRRVVRRAGVKGKYSIVPYPACVGWVDRDMPGWTQGQLEASLKLVRDFMSPDWDIHPEMVTHTWVINPKTGRPYEERTERYMENWGWSVGRSVDELADYLAYALRILKNAGLPCEGVTTPGGFGNRAPRRARAGDVQARAATCSAPKSRTTSAICSRTTQALPRRSSTPRDSNTDDPECVVSIIGCTGDWFGGWDGLETGHVDQFITADLKGGRLPQVIDRGEPAILVCHWPGIYYNGEEYGFNIFKEVVERGCTRRLRQPASG